MIFGGVMSKGVSTNVETGVVEQEKCGLKFDHYDEITKYDNSATFKAKAYIMEIED